MIEPGATQPSGVGPVTLWIPAGGVKGTVEKSACTVCGVVMLRTPGAKLPDRSPSQCANLKPPFALTLNVTCVPAGKNPSGDGGVVVKLPALAGYTAVDN